MPVMIVKDGVNGAACRTQSVLGYAWRRRCANPPAAALLTGQAARERAPDAGRLLCLVCSSSEEMGDNRC